MRKTVKIRGKEISVKLLTVMIAIAFLVGVAVGITLQNAIIFKFQIGTTSASLSPSTLEIDLGTITPGASGSGIVDASTMPKLYCSGSVNLTLCGDLAIFDQFEAKINFFEWGTGNPKGSTTVSLASPSVVYNVGAKECSMSMDYSYKVRGDATEGFNGAIWIEFNGIQSQS